MSWTVAPATQFADFAKRWQALNDDTLASPLLAVDWVAPLLREFGSGRECIACHVQDGQVTAMAILTPRGRGAWETFQPSQAPIGLWMHRPNVDIALLAASLMRALPRFPLVLGLTQLDPDLTVRPTDGGRVRTLDYVQTARVTISGSFEEYWTARGKNLRQNMKKQRNKLEKEGTSTRLQCTTAQEDVAAILADYGRLESAGWKADIGTAIHPDNAQGRFYQAMLESFARRGAARMYRYWFNDRVVAMDLCIDGGNHLVILKTTYDESIKDGSSPAFLLRQDQFEQLFNEGRFRAIEFYGKVMDWHLKWTSEVRMLYHVNAYRFEGLAYLHGRGKQQQEAAASAAQALQGSTLAPLSAVQVAPIAESKPD